MFDVLLISEDPKIITELQKIAAVTQCSLEINSKINHSEVRIARTVIIDAALNVVVNHPDVVIITASEPGVKIWQKAVATGAKFVAFLPDAREWLIQNLISNSKTVSNIIGVLGSTGGIGTSVIASSIAATFVSEDNSVLLAEFSNFTGGLDVLWGIEDQKGIRLPDLTSEILPRDVFRSLPKNSGVYLLSGDSKKFIAKQISLDTISGLTSEVNLTVFDLPSPNDANFEPVLNSCQTLILVVGNTIRSISAANQLLLKYNQLTNCKLVVRNLPGTGLDALSISNTLGLSLAAQIPTDLKITEQLEQGLSPAQISSHSFKKAIAEIMQELDTSNVSSVA